MKVSIVIRCYNEEEHIGRLLSGIAQQEHVDREIIVVDSGSTDATLSIVSAFPASIVHITPDRFSFGRSLNMGCAASTGEVIVLASAHVYPLYRDWLTQLLAPFADDRVACIYGRQCGDERTRYSEHQVFARWFPEHSDPDQQHTFCNNANAAIRRAVWESTPYDETLTGLEDIDWVRRVMKKGWKLTYCAGAIVAHIHDETSAMIRNRYRREAIAMKSIYPDQRFRWYDFLRFWIANVFSDAYHACHDGVLSSSLVDIIRFRLMQFWGTWRGYARHGTVTQRLKETFYYPKGLTRQPPEDAGVDDGRAIDYSRLTNPGDEHVEP